VANSVWTRAESAARALKRKRILDAHAAIDVAEGLHFAGEGFIFKIHLDQPELFRVTELPFKIVQQRPVEKSAHIHAKLQRAMQRGQVVLQILRAENFVGGSRAVFGQVDG